MKLFVGVYVEYFDFSVTVSCCNELVFIPELRCHELSWMSVDFFNSYFAFMMGPFDNP